MILNTQKRYQIQKEKEKGTSEALKGYYAMQTTQVFIFVCGRFENPTQKETFTPTQFPKTRNSIEGMKLQNPV